MRVKVGVIGTGAIGIEHIDRINQKTQGAYVTAVSDINVKAAKEVAKRVDAKFFETGEALIASEDVDVVVVTSWDPTHEQVCVRSNQAWEICFLRKAISDGCSRLPPDR